MNPFVNPVRWQRWLASGWLSCLLALAGLTTGCQSLSYYGQAIRGQYDIVSMRQPIPKLIADPKTPGDLKAKLELIIRLRQFAENNLKLRADGHYLDYVDLHRRFVVWNVHATPEFSLEPRTWWYPVVGSLKYRGYFSEAEARRYGAKLEQKHWEVYVDGVEAYSTLGWFRDPVLNTFVYHEEADLAETIFHELTHQRVFISGDTDFNEAFATAVSEEGVRRWFAAAGNAMAIQEYAADVVRHNQFVQLVLSARQKLKVMYQDPVAMAKGDGYRRQQKQAIIAGLRQQYEQMKAGWSGYDGYDHWFSRSLSNAQLNTVATYDELVPAFHQMLARRNGDLEAFYDDVRALGKLSKTERHQRLLDLLKPN